MPEAVKDRSEQSRQYYLRNKEKILAQQKVRHAANPENGKRRSRESYLRNREKVLARQKAYQAANPELVRARKKKWADENRDQIRERGKLATAKWLAKNPEKRSEVWSRYYSKNKEKLLAQKSIYNRQRYLKKKDELLAKGRKWMAENKDRSLAQQKEYRKRTKSERARSNKAWRESNPEWIQKYRKENRHVEIRAASKRRALKRGATISDLESIKKWTARITSSPAFRCYYCDRLTSSLDVHFDHILPLSRFKLHNITNLCASCSSCNLSKGVKLPSEWIENGQLIFDI